MYLLNPPLIDYWGLTPDQQYFSYIEATSSNLLICYTKRKLELTYMLQFILTRYTFGKPVEGYATIKIKRRWSSTDILVHKTIKVSLINISIYEQRLITGRQYLLNY